MIAFFSDKMTAYKEVANYFDTSERSVQTWVREFEENGELAADSRGRHSKIGVWPLADPVAREQWELYARTNSQPKGKQNLTAVKMVKYWQETLSPSLRKRIADGDDVCQILSLTDVPQQISTSTARNWLLKTGFTYDRNQKGEYVDGHERWDVVRDRKKYLVFKK